MRSEEKKRRHLSLDHKPPPSEQPKWIGGGIETHIPRRRCRSRRRRRRGVIRWECLGLQGGGVWICDGDFILEGGTRQKEEEMERVAVAEMESSRGGMTSRKRLVVFFFLCFCFCFECFAFFFPFFLQMLCTPCVCLSCYLTLAALRSVLVELRTNKRCYDFVDTR